VAGTRWQAVAALVDPVRRALYDYVCGQDHPVTREEAADARALSRNLTAFQLDTLVDAELLRARDEAPGDQPRGRGRTPKVSEPAGDGLSITVPQRQYERVGQILADAVAEAPTDAATAAARLAFEHGRRSGQAGPVLLTTAGQLSRTAPDQLSRTAAVLADLGFEPRRQRPVGGPVTLSLRNCPFHRLAVRQPELVCGLSHAFVRGLLAGLGASTLTAALAPSPGACCVVVRAGPAPAVQGSAP
jgi:predicted ArsR family transcriptional regulator